MKIAQIPSPVVEPLSARAPGGVSPRTDSREAARTGGIFGPAATVSFSWNREGARPPGSTQDAAAPDDAEQRKVQELERRDREVRVHEQAHKAVGGPHAGAIHLDLQRGPDGASYAVGGSVPIDVSPVAGDPAATVQKMNIVRRAALAPADPSAADRQVAARAAQLLSQARVELAKQSTEGATTVDGEPKP